MRTALSVAAVAAVLLVACTSGVRYSPAELRKFPPELQEHIRKGEVLLGMSQSAVRYAWGAPSAVNVMEPDERDRFREEWVYKDSFRMFKTRLVFVEGTLAEIVSSDPKLKTRRAGEEAAQ